MATSQIRFHDCFDVLAGESKPRKCKCPNRVSPIKAQGLVASGKAKFLNSRSIVSLTVHTAGSSNSGDFTETDRQFIKYFRRLVPELNLSNSNVLDVVRDPENAIGVKAYAASRQLSKDYWRKVLSDQRLSMNRGQCLSDAPHGRGQLISGGYDSEKVSHLCGAYESDDGSYLDALINKEISRLVKAANFRKGKFNDGIIGSAGAGPDDFSSDGSSSMSSIGAKRTNSNKIYRDPYKPELNGYFNWEVGEISATVLSLRNKGYSEGRMMAEILQNIVPVFNKKAVTLICRQCGVHTARVLNVPADVTVSDKQSSVCVACTNQDLHLPSKKIAVLDREELAASTAQLNEQFEPVTVSEGRRSHIEEVLAAD